MSDVGGRGMTLSDILGRHARGQRDAIALIDAAHRRTYAELDRRVTRLANVLRDRDVRPGDRVAVMAGNSIEVLESYYAIARIGAVCVTINFRLTPTEIAYLLADSGARCALVGDELAAGMRTAREKAPDVGTVIHLGREYEDLLAAAADTPVQLAVDDDAAAFIMYTSGTTGHPKGAVLTHRNLFLHGLSQIAFLGIPRDDRVYLSGAPLFHIAGLAGTIPPLINGGRSVIIRSGGFDPAATVRLLADERVSSCFFVPSQWAAVCAVPDLASHDLSALRRLSWGAAPASLTLLRTMMTTFPHAEVVSSFGQTECSPVTCALRGEDSVRKIGSVGTPMTNVEVRVVDDDMRDVPVGEVGEIVYRGPMVMKEYWNNPVATAEAFRGGWFHSGDLVRRDDEGYVYVVDRKKDMIISGGENIYCAELENVVADHPKVAEVAVIGVPDECWGETPVAVVVARDPAEPPSTDEIRAFCRERLASYKLPRRTVTVDSLPRNAGGKVLKTELRERYGPVESSGPRRP
jgi:acyl-CoA synthetase (AMP-forming)/AMP-acid ligase II